MSDRNFTKAILIIGLVLIASPAIITAVDWTGYPVSSGDLLTAGMINRLMYNVRNMTDYIYSDDATGFVGIGTPNPQATLHLVHNLTNEAGGLLKIDSNLKGNIAGGDKYQYGIDINVDSSATGIDNPGNRQYIRGIRTLVDVTGTTQEALGIENAINNKGPNPMKNLKGSSNWAYHQGTGTVDNVYGITATGMSGSGIAKNAYGGYFEAFHNGPAGTINQATGVFSAVGGVSTIDNGTALFGSCADSNLCYGLYIQAGDPQVPVGQDWGVYVGGEDKNYFSGNVGIGTTAPKGILHVNNPSGSSRMVLSGSEYMDLNGVFHLNSFLFKDNEHPQFWAMGTRGQSNPSGANFLINYFNDTLGDGDTTNGANWNKAFIISEYGNVGVGTTNPSERLDVDGNVRANAFLYSSDRILKHDIQNIIDPLAKVVQLDGVSFVWNSSGEGDIGLIAQDVEKVFPELVKTDPNSGLKSVEYGNLVAPLIEAIKQQQKQIERLENENIEIKRMLCKNHPEEKICS